MTETENKKRSGLTNTELLEEAIAASGYKKGFLAEQCGLSLAGFRNCVVNEAEFTGRQILTLCILLKLDRVRGELIFFDRSGVLNTPE